jgi:hypothetical protein
MQADLASLFPATAIVLRDSPTTTGGRLAHSWAAAGTYAARLAYQSNNATSGAAIAGRAETPGDWWLSLHGTLGTAALQAGDRVTVAGTTYEVETVHYTPGETVAWRARLVEGQG